MESPTTHEQSGEASRRWTRYKIDVRLKVVFSAEGKEASAFGRANSLSRGGMGAYIPCSIPVGTKVSLEMTFPYSSLETRLEAIIRSCEGFRYGLEFTRVPGEIQDVLVKNCGPELLQ
jgi:hypothetical protein